MLSLSSVLLAASAALLAAAPASARIVALHAPATAALGQNLSIQLESYSYIQNWNDYGVIVGLARPDIATCGTCVGQQQAYLDLQASNETQFWHGNKSFSVPVSDYLAPGEYTLVAAVPHLVGASGSTGISYFNSSITLTNSTSA